MSHSDGNRQRRRLARVDCMPFAPGEWTKCGFRDVANVNPVYKLNPNGVYPFVEMAAVAEEFAGIKEFAPRQFQSGFSRFRQNDTIFAKITPCAEHGKVALVDNLPTDFATGSTEFIVLSPKDGVDPRYLFYLVTCPAVHRRAVSRMEGSTGRLRVSESTFTKWLWVALPDAEEQTRIAETLKAADDHIRALEEQIRKAEQVKKALIQEEFTGSEKHGNFLTIGNIIVQPITNGYSPICPQYETGAWVLALDALTEQGYAPKGCKPAPIDDPKLVGNELRKNDILISRSNTRERVGQAGLYDGVPENCYYPDLMMRVRVGSDRVRTRYLDLFLRSESARRFIQSRAGGTSGSMVKIKERDIRQMPFVLPKVEVQDVIIARIDSATCFVSSLYSQLTAARRVKQSLLQNLLTGKIRLQP